MTVVKPWKGDCYQDGKLFGRRVLVLGESHYDTDLPPDSEGRALAASDEDFTIWCVRNLAIVGPNPYFTKVANLLLGTPHGTPSPERKAELWHGVAFANYVQWMFARPSKRGEPARRPTEEMWMAAQAPLLTLVGTLRPDVLVVLGTEMSGWLPSLPPEIVVASVAHPSSGGGWAYADWLSTVNSALGRERR